MKIRLVVEYVGNAFSGWQMQANAPTVQGEITRALEVCIRALAKKAGVFIERMPTINGSGRTDAGVHAYAQHLSFFWPEELECDTAKLKRSLNGILDPSIGVRRVFVEDDAFDARRNSHEKCYRYDLLLRDSRAVLDWGRAWRIGRELNIAAMIEASHLFLGEHDFKCFRAQDCSAATTIRVVIKSELVRKDNEHLSFYVCGKGFLRNMVRIMMGTLVGVGLGDISIERVRELVAAEENLSRSEAGQTAPAYGLHLEWVKY